MIELLRLGEHTIHDDNFDVNRPTGHPHYLLLLIKTPARFLIDEQWMSIPKNQAVLFLPGQRHRYHADQETYIDDWAHIVSPQPLPGTHFPFGMPIPLHHPKDFYDLFHIINNVFFSASTQRAMTLHHLTSALVNMIAEESKTQEYPALYYDLVSLREKIYKYPKNDWRVPDMAKDLNISAGYLHSIYQQFFHTTCINDVIQSRIQASCDLLISTTKPLDEIALSCGYQHTEHFIRQFKNAMGTTPGKYRKAPLNH